MKQSIASCLLLMLSLPIFGQAEVVDSFDGYKSGRLQDQQAQAGSWAAPSGVGVAEGLLSTPAGFEKLGAQLIVNWTGGAVARNRFVFAKPKVCKPGAVVAVHLSAQPMLPATTVCVIVRGESGAEWRTAPQPLTASAFTRYVFPINEGSAVRIAGRDSIEEVLADVSNILIQFSNPTGSGVQSIVMDNFAIFPDGKVPAQAK